MKQDENNSNFTIIIEWLASAARALQILLMYDDPFDHLKAEEALALMDQPCTLETVDSGGVDLGTASAAGHRAP